MVVRPPKLQVEKNMPKSKIDKGRALSILGFSSSRPIDACLGDSDLIRQILDEKLFMKTQEILHAPAKKGAAAAAARKQRKRVR